MTFADRIPPLTEADAPPDQLEADLSAFRAEWETTRRWGMKNTATLAPMDALQAQRARDNAYSYYFAPYPHASLEVIKRLYRDTVDAINVAVIRKAKKPRSSSKIRATLLERDGANCWLCHDPLGADMTIEHKIALANGGTWAFHNLALAHHDCNRLMGRAGIVAKEAARRELKGAS